MNVEWIPREEPLKPVCRHCSEYRRRRFSHVWAAFFESNFVLRGFDHISCDKFWFVSEPYLDREAAENCYLVLRAIEGGAKVYGVDPGYHHEGVVTLIVVPGNVKRFIEAVNKTLNAYKRDTLLLLYQLDKSAARRLIKEYAPPSPRECLRKALDYLTWRDLQK